MSFKVYEAINLHGYSGFFALSVNYYFNIQKSFFMGHTTKGSNNSLLMEFFTDELKDIYWAEQHLTKTLPKMAEKATTAELAQAFESHCDETEGHVARLEEIFEMIGENAQTKKCDAMAGIIAEGESIISDTQKDTMTRDVGLIFAGQKAEHYEIATYGGLINIAKTLGLADVAEILVQTLEEEKAADDKLTGIAETNVNQAASGEES